MTPAETLAVPPGPLPGAAGGAKFGHEAIANTIKGDFAVVEMGFVKAVALMAVVFLPCLLGLAFQISLVFLFPALRMSPNVLLPILLIGALGMAALSDCEVRQMIQDDLYTIAKSLGKFLRLLAMGFAVWMNFLCVLVFGPTVVIPFIFFRFLVRDIITIVHDVKSFFFEPLARPQEKYDSARALAKKEGHNVCTSWARVSICSTDAISDLDLNLSKSKSELVPELSHAIQQKKKQKGERGQLQRTVAEWKAEVMKQQGKEADDNGVSRRGPRKQKRRARRASFWL